MSPSLIFHAKPLRKNLIDQEIKQKDLAAKMGLTATDLNAYIAGRKKPGLRFVSRLMLATDTPFETYFEIKAGTDA